MSPCLSACKRPFDLYTLHLRANKIKRIELSEALSKELQSSRESAFHAKLAAFGAKRSAALDFESKDVNLQRYSSPANGTPSRPRPVKDFINSLEESSKLADKEKNLIESPERTRSNPPKHEGRPRSSSASRWSGVTYLEGSPESTFEIPLDKVYSSPSQPKDKTTHFDLSAKVLPENKLTSSKDKVENGEMRTRVDKPNTGDFPAQVRPHHRRSSSTSKLSERTSGGKRWSSPLGGQGMPQSNHGTRATSISVGSNSKSARTWPPTLTRSNSTNSAITKQGSSSKEAGHKPLFSRQGSIGRTDIGKSSILKQESASNSILRTHSSNGNLKQDGALNSAGSRHGSSGNLKQESVSASTLQRQASSGKLKQEFVSTSTFQRQASSGNLKQERTPKNAGTRHGGNGTLKQETVSNSSFEKKNGIDSFNNFKQDGTSSSPVSISSSNGNLGRESTSNSEGTKQGNNDNLKQATTLKSSVSTKARGKDNVKVPVTGVAAASFNGGWLYSGGMLPYPDDMSKLNKFLGDCKSEVEAGVPGRYLTVIMGSEASDLDSIVSSITYAFFLHSTGSEDRQCFVPVINMRLDDLALHTEAVWLFETTGLDTSNFMFVDQVSLSYFHRFGSLRLVLVDHSRLAPHQENLQEAVVEIVDHNVPENIYPWVSSLEIEQVGSCCTIIAERYAAEAPELLAGRGVNRLLLGPILLDTANLDAKVGRCTSRDECMAAFLIHGAGRYGRNGFFRLLRRKQFDVSALSTRDMMRKDFKQWTLGPGKTDVCDCQGQQIAAGMSTLSVPLIEFLSRRDVMDELKRFRRGSKLDVHLVVTGYYDSDNRYKREILVVPDRNELTQHLFTCFNARKGELKLSNFHVEGWTVKLPEEMMAFKQGNVIVSRQVVRQMLADFFAM